MNKEPRLIALYLPQYHPIPENNKWWGEGFTEWTNVGKAKPLFKGHHQPRVPADLGYYDLRLPESRKAQAELAKECGIEGFCYWHYWFGDGKRLLERPFNEVLQSGEPDFPFCLGWANHSWQAKTWSPNGKNVLLIEQKYGGIEDFTNHFLDVLPAFKDRRYIKVDNKPFFLIWDPNDIPDTALFINHWNKLAKENGLDGIYFVASANDKKEVEKFKAMGFDAVSLDLQRKVFLDKNSIRAGSASLDLIWKIFLDKNKIRNVWLQIRRTIKGIPKYLDYDEYTDYFLQNLPISDTIIPSVIPNFDHSPRSGKYGTVLINDSPKKFELFLRLLFNKLSLKKKETNIVILRSWNEWGEGNYLEPDLKNGTGFLEAIKKSKMD